MVSRRSFAHWCSVNRGAHPRTDEPVDRQRRVVRPLRTIALQRTAGCCGEPWKTRSMKRGAGATSPPHRRLDGRNAQTITDAWRSSLGQRRHPMEHAREAGYFADRAEPRRTPRIQVWLKLRLGSIGGGASTWKTTQRSSEPPSACQRPLRR